MTFRENALSHGHVVLGASNKITLVDEDNPLVMLDTIDLRGYDEKTLLIHYKATIADEENIGDTAWFSLDEVRMLDAKNETSSENVVMVTERFLK